MMLFQSRTKFSSWTIERASFDNKFIRMSFPNKQKIASWTLQAGTIFEKLSGFQVDNNSTELFQSLPESAFNTKRTQSYLFTHHLDHKIIEK